MPEANTVAPTRKLKRPIEEVRAELLANEDVKEQARLLKVPVEQYVEKILDYAQHPEKPPQVQVLSDEELKAQDPSAPTTEEIHAHLRKLASGEISISPAHRRDGFSNSDQEKPERFQVALGTAGSLQGQAAAPTPGQGPDFKRPPPEKA